MVGCLFSPKVNKTSKLPKKSKASGLKSLATAATAGINSYSSSKGYTATTTATATATIMPTDNEASPRYDDTEDRHNGRLDGSYAPSYISSNSNTIYNNPSSASYDPYADIANLATIENTKRERQARRKVVQEMRAKRRNEELEQQRLADEAAFIKEKQHEASAIKVAMLKDKTAQRVQKLKVCAFCLLLLLLLLLLSMVFFYGLCRLVG